MSLKSFTLACLCLFFSIQSFAQAPAPCPSNAYPPSDLCSDACVYCNLISITSTTTGYTSQTPPGFCGTVENEQWIGFTASAGAATFTATPTGCTNGDGVQIAIYESCLGMPIACYGGCGGCEGTPANVTVGMVPGQVYFVMIDGFAGDQCNFVLTSNPPMGSGGISLGLLGNISGPETACPGQTVEFSVPPLTGAASYVWEAPVGSTINGQDAPAEISALDGGHKVTVVFGAASGTVCAQAVNVCDASTRPCKPVTVAPIPPTDLPPVTICFEDIPYQTPWGQNVSASGTYQRVYPSVQGCDSVVRQQITVKNPIIRQLPQQVVCPGDSLVVCGQSIETAGVFSVACQSWQGCDSLVTGTVVFAPPAAQIASPNQTITCTQPFATLSSVPGGTFGTNIQWLDGQGNVIGTEPSLTVAEPGFYTLQSLSAGTSGCKADAFAVVKKNTIVPSLVASGGTWSPQNPLVQLRAHSVNSPVRYRWTGPQGFNSTLQNPIVGVAGTYTVTVTNTQTGCSNSAQVVVSQ